MKKIFSIMAVGALLAMSSCSDEQPVVNADDDGYVEISISAQLPDDLRSRATTTATGELVKDLQWFLFDSEGIVKDRGKIANAFSSGDRVETLNIRMMKNGHYIVAFWTDSGDSPYTITDDGKMNIDTSKCYINDEKADAFYGAIKVIADNTLPSLIDVTMRRPFAQVNFGDPNFHNLDVEIVPTGIIVKDEADDSGTEGKGIYTTLELYTGFVSNPAGQITFKQNPDSPMPNEGTCANPAQFTVAGNTYDYIAYAYVLAPENGELLQEVSLLTSKGDKGPFTNVPMKQNYRTNIIGNILTASNSIEVIVEAAFANSGSQDEDINVQTIVSNATELKEAIANLDQNIMLSSDVTMNTGNTFIKDDIEIDLCGNTLTFTNVAKDKYGFVNSYDKELKISNGKIKTDDTFQGNLIWGNCEFDNVEIYAAANTKSVAFGRPGKTISIKNSIIQTESYYGIASNASSVVASSEPLTFTMENTQVTSLNPVVINIPAYVTIKNCTLTGWMSPVTMRGGTWVLEDCRLIYDTSHYTDDAHAQQWANSPLYDTYFWNQSSYGGNWGQGNGTDQAGIVMGNRKPGSYQYPTNVTLKNTKVEITQSYSSYFPAVYADANQGDGLGVTFNYDSACTFTVNGHRCTFVYASDNIVVNGATLKGEYDADGTYLREANADLSNP